MTTFAKLMVTSLPYIKRKSVKEVPLFYWFTVQKAMGRHLRHRKQRKKRLEIFSERTCSNR